MSLSLKLSGLPTVQNISLETGVEKEIVFDADVKKILMQTRGTGDLKMAFALGETATKYFTLKGSSVYYEDFIHGPFTMYVLSGESAVLEIITWTNRD